MHVRNGRLGPPKDVHIFHRFPCGQPWDRLGTPGDSCRPWGKLTNNLGSRQQPRDGCPPPAELKRGTCPQIPHDYYGVLFNRLPRVRESVL